MRTDEWTDMTKLVVAFHNFANAPKNSTFCLQSVLLWYLWSQNKQQLFLTSIRCFHIRTVHLAIIKFLFIHQLMH